MTKESIEQRKVELQKQLEQIQATGNAVVGAIQDCDYWLSQLEIKEGVE
jgi:hypothetical protein